MSGIFKARPMYLSKYNIVPALFFSSMIAACNKQENTDPRCTMPPDPGICTAAIERYYYDPVDKTCKPFTWGGCGDFPFATLQECVDCGCDK